jgi:hypothetical protein
LLDRLLPYVEPLPAHPNPEHLEARLICIEICGHLFIERPPEEDRFSEIFDSFFRRINSVMSPAVPASLAVHGFRTAIRLLSASKFRFASEQYAGYWGQFVETSASHPMLKRLVMRVMNLNSLCDYSATKLARVILQHEPNQDEIWSIAAYLSQCQNKPIEKPVSILQSLFVMAVSDQIMARTCCKALPLLIRAIEGVIPWVVAFIRKVTGFVVMAQRRRECETDVGLVFELFTALYRTQIEWVQEEISRGAAILLASQKVTMALVAGFKPAIRYDPFDLHQWEIEAAKGYTICLSSMISTISEEPPPHPARSGVSLATRTQLPPKIVSLSIEFSPRNGVINRTRNPKRAVVRPNRFIRGSQSLAF